MSSEQYVALSGSTIVLPRPFALRAAAIVLTLPEVEAIPTGIEYKQALVTYVDLLGFKQWVADSSQHAEEVRKISDLLRTVKDRLSLRDAKHYENDAEARTFQSTSFSDLIVRCTAMPPNNGFALNWITSEFCAVASFQAEFAGRGVLLRGAICIGDVVFESDIVFGPGLVAAYELEAHFAVFPRVVIDRDLVNRLTDTAEKEDRVHWSTCWGDFVRRGEDGLYFLDYLFGTFIAPWRWNATEFRKLPPSGEPWTILSAHGGAIRNALRGGVKDAPEPVKQKYLWLALYHNSVIDRLRSELPNEVHEGLEAERIDSALLKL
jgi:hypothetical protein